MELSKWGADSQAPLSAGWRVAAGRGRHCHCQGRKSRGRKHWGPGRSQCWRLPVPPGGSAARPERSGLPETQEKYTRIYALGYCPQAHVWLLDSDKSIYTEVKHTCIPCTQMVLHADDSLYFLYRGSEARAHTQTHTHICWLTWLLLSNIHLVIAGTWDQRLKTGGTQMHQFYDCRRLIYLRTQVTPAAHIHTLTHIQTHDIILPMIKWRRRRRRWMPGCCPCLCHGDEHRWCHRHLFFSRHPSSSRSPQTTRMSTSLVQKQK